jgi:cytochrome c oxidase cbb3-type subunit IV
VDLSDLRTIVTTLSFVAFVGLVFWAYSGKQKKRFDEAANLPFVDADEGLGTQRKPRSPGGVHE